MGKQIGLQNDVYNELMGVISDLVKAWSKPVSANDAVHYLVNEYKFHQKPPAGAT